jgi:putative ABC transport system permease protein
MHDRIFRVLLKLLPAEFRGEYGREMESTFRAERTRARGLAGARLWAATIADILRTAPSEHLDILARDTRFAFRMMARRPLHTIAAAATLALGIGANVAMFAVIEGVLLSPLPYREPDALVVVQEQREGDEPGTMGYLTFADLRERVRTLTSMAAASQSSGTLTGDGREPERVSAVRVSSSYFSMIGVAPILGRAFTDSEDRPGQARRVAILSDALWRRRFGGDPSVIGRPMMIGTTAHTVMGVMPPGFSDLVAGRLYEDAELWLPLGYDPAAAFACRTCRHLRVFGRLAPGQDTASASREMSGIINDLAGRYPSQYHSPSVVVRSMADFFLGPVRPVLLVLWAGVAVLLLVACANVANLLLLRASEREHEVAVRAALGVTRVRLARQLLTESAWLALAGGAGGLMLAWGAVIMVRVSGPSQLPRLESIGVDMSSVLAALAMSIGSGMIFGLVPLRQINRNDHQGMLTGAGKRTDGGAAWRLRATLIAANVAMAAVLLVGSGLVVRSLLGLLAVEPGFDADRVLTMRVILSGERYSSGPPASQIAAVTSFYSDVLDRVRALPGVESASAATLLPLAGGRDQYGLHIAGRPQANPEEAPAAHRFVVQPGIFETLRVPLLRGRTLDARDAAGRTNVAVINRSLADDLFPGEDPLGHQVMLGLPSAPVRTIVGVVGDVRHEGLHMAPGYQVWVPQAQWAWAEPMLTLTVRTAGEPLRLAVSVRRLVRERDAAQPVTNVRAYTALVAESTGTRRFAAALLAAFAGTSLLLAVVGLYGALGVVVRQRRREIGLRLALGAAAAEISRMVLVQGMRPVAAGLALGLLAAAASAQGLRALLFQVEARDPLTFVVAAAVLSAFALVACVLPAWRAARVDPATMLRD